MDKTTRQLAEKIARAKEKIRAAAARAGRNPGDVSVLFATKYADAKTIAALCEIIPGPGKIVVGENRVPDAEKKFAELDVLLAAVQKQRLIKHFIGSLQSNKVKDAVRLFDAIESVDSLKLAEKIDAEARRQNKRVLVFLEVNVSGEESKHGFRIDESEDAVKKIRQLTNLQLVGLMTMAPREKDKEKIRPVFRELKRLANRYSLATSMGMSDDFEVAVEEGSDEVRLGRTIFSE